MRLTRNTEANQISPNISERGKKMKGLNYIYVYISVYYILNYYPILFYSKLSPFNLLHYFDFELWFDRDACGHIHASSVSDNCSRLENNLKTCLITKAVGVEIKLAMKQ